MALVMRWASAEAGQVIDPHTAIGLAAARLSDEVPAEVPVVTLATAHPAKFRDAVERATGIRPHLPTRVSGLFAREERFATLPADLKPNQAHTDSSKATTVGKEGASKVRNRGREGQK